MESVEQELVELLRRADLNGFEVILASHQITKVKHLQDVTDQELQALGIFSAAVRRLRNEIHLLATFRDFESISRISIKIQKEKRLGSGQFGTVYKAIWKKDDNQQVECAVKCLNEDASPEVNDEFCKEMTSMQRLVHGNIVRFYGVIIDRPIFMVMEYCENGALFERLKNSRRPLLLTTMMDYASQIIDGMAFLASQKVVHRDLAARNILLTKNEKVIKIGDLGLARIVYEDTYLQMQKRKLPIAWTAPEALFTRLFSHASDVWAFGVTLWEMFSYGEEPWSTLSPVELGHELRRGTRLRRTPRCPPIIYEVMLRCWREVPESRPEFGQLKEEWQKASALPPLQTYMMCAYDFYESDICIPSFEARSHTRRQRQIHLEIYECQEVYENVDFMLTPGTKFAVISKSGFYDGQNLSTGKFGPCPPEILRKISYTDYMKEAKARSNSLNTPQNKARSNSFGSPKPTTVFPSVKVTEKNSTTQATYFSSTPMSEGYVPGKEAPPLPPPKNSHAKKAVPLPPPVFIPQPDYNLKLPSQGSAKSDDGTSGYGTSPNLSTNTSFSSFGYKDFDALRRSISMENLSTPMKPNMPQPVAKFQTPRLESNKPKFSLGGGSGRVQVDPNKSRENLFAELQKKVGGEEKTPMKTSENAPKSEEKPEKTSIFARFNFKPIKTMFPSSSLAQKPPENDQNPSISVQTPTPTSPTAVFFLPTVIKPLPRPPETTSKGSEAAPRVQRRPTKRGIDRSRRKSIVNSGSGRKAVAAVKEIIEEAEVPVVPPPMSPRPALPSKKHSAPSMPTSNGPQEDEKFVYPLSKPKSEPHLPKSPPPPPLKPRTTSSNSNLDTSNVSLPSLPSSGNVFIRKQGNTPLPLPPKVPPKMETMAVAPPPLPKSSPPVAEKKRELAKISSVSAPENMYEQEKVNHGVVAGLGPRSVLNTSTTSLVDEMRQKLNSQGLHFTNHLQPSSSTLSLPNATFFNQRQRPALMPKPTKHVDSTSSKPPTSFLNTSHPILPSSLLRSDMPAPKLPSSKPTLPATPTSAPPVPPRRHSVRSMNGLVNEHKTSLPENSLSSMNVEPSVIKFREIPSEQPKTLTLNVTRFSTDSWTEPEEVDDDDKSRGKARLSKNGKKSPYAKTDFGRGPLRTTIKKKKDKDVTPGFFTKLFNKKKKGTKDE